MLVFLLAALVGLSLGLLGSGGSILAVPILRYAGGLGAKQAVLTSLATVGAVSLVGAVLAWREKRLNPSLALRFALLASAGTFAGARLALRMSDALQMGLFVAVMLAALVSIREPKDTTMEKRAGPLQSVLQPLLVGVLTGLVGVGGGFVIVPALVAIYRLPIKQATGTSLGVIALNSLIGVLSYSGRVALDLSFTVEFIGAALGGLLLGLAAGRKVENHVVQRTFQVSLVLVAAYTGWRELSMLMASG